MDTDAHTLEQALAVLQSNLGPHLAGDHQSGLGRMVRELQQQLRIDDLAADRLVKKLAETGRLRYMGGMDDAGGMVPGTIIAGNPISAQPSTAATAPVDVPMAPAIGLVGLNNPGSPGGVLVPGMGAAMAAEQAAGETVPRETLEDAENRSGATMGQLADTNVEGEAGNILAPVRDQAHDEGLGRPSGGYWQIG